MGRDGERIDGWKTIGAHFWRDRTTAIRWANDRDLPVHRVPGGKTATVHALKSELDGWLGSRRRGDTIAWERSHWRPAIIAATSANSVLGKS